MLNSWRFSGARDVWMTVTWELVEVSVTIGVVVAEKIDLQSSLPEVCAARRPITVSNRGHNNSQTNCTV